jgi:hypothetical protein
MAGQSGRPDYRPAKVPRKSRTKREKGGWVRTVFTINLVFAFLSFLGSLFSVVVFGPVFLLSVIVGCWGIATAFALWTLASDYYGET